MTNVSIEITLKNYEGSFPRRPAYRAMNARIQFAEGTETIESTLITTNPVNFTETALTKVADIVVSNEYEPAEITVTTDGFELSEAIKMHLTEKYAIDPAINSVTFE
jgi:hypothetical protein